VNKNSNPPNFSMNDDVELGEIIRSKSATPNSFEPLIPKEQIPKLLIKPGNKHNQSTSNLESLNSSTKTNFVEKFDPKFKKIKSNLNPNLLPQFTTNQLPETNPLIENLLHQSLPLHHPLPPPPFDPQDPSTISPEALLFLSLAHHASQNQFQFPGFDHNQLNQSLINQSNEASVAELNVNVKKRKHNSDANSTNKSFKTNLESNNNFNEESRSSSSSNSNNGIGQTSFNNSL